MSDTKLLKGTTVLFFAAMCFWFYDDEKAADECIELAVRTLYSKGYSHEC